MSDGGRYDVDGASVEGRYDMDDLLVEAGKRWTTCQIEADMILMTCYMEAGHKVDNVSDGGRYCSGPWKSGSSLRLNWRGVLGKPEKGCWEFGMGGMGRG